MERRQKTQQDPRIHSIARGGEMEAPTLELTSNGNPVSAEPDVMIPEILLERITDQANRISSGERDPRLRKALFDKAYKLLHSRLVESRTF
jgi:hypothetical protein